MLSIFIYIHSHTGLKTHGEFVIIGGNFFDQSPDKRFVVFRQGGGMFPQKGVHIGNPLFHVIPTGVFQL